MLKVFTFVQVAADSLRTARRGQTMAEYGVVLAVITLTVIGRSRSFRQRPQRDRERRRHRSRLGADPRRQGDVLPVVGRSPGG